MFKECTPLRREAHFEIKCSKSFGALLEVDMMKKCTALWHEAHFEANMLKTRQLRSAFGG